MSDKDKVSKTQNKDGGSPSKRKSKSTKQGNVDSMHYDCCYIDTLIKYDVIYTEKLAVCARPKSPLYRYRWVMKVLEISCHGIPWLLGSLVGILMSHQIWMHEILLNLFAALIFDCIIVGVTKGLVRRNRPAINNMDMFVTVSVDKFSFPSGHTTRVAMVTCFLFHVFPSLSMLETYMLMLWSVSVALSRIALGRHHILDVVCGLIIGVLQYVVFVIYLWIPSDLCEKIIRPIAEDLHL